MNLNNTNTLHKSFVILSTGILLIVQSSKYVTSIHYPFILKISSKPCIISDVHIKEEKNSKKLCHCQSILS